MVKSSVALMVGLAFCMGLVLGLLLHLPGVSSPLGAGRHRRAVGSAGSAAAAAAAGGRLLLSAEDYSDAPGPAPRSDPRPSEGAGHASGNGPGLGKDRYVASSSSSSGGGGGGQRVPAAGSASPDTVSVIIHTRSKGERHRDASPPAGSARAVAPPSGDAPRPPLNQTWLQTGASAVARGTVFWSPAVEALIPTGFRTSGDWRRQLDGVRVVGIKEGCGRMQNRLLELSDGTRACGRYRINQDQIQGELYSYYLSLLLGIRNVPPAVLALPDAGRDRRWGSVSRGLAAAQWDPDRPVIVTPWIPHLTPAYIPEELRPHNRSLHPAAILTAATPTLDPPDSGTRILKGKTPDELQELAQWSDLIVFDYLTGNLDRVVNNLFNLQWNKDMMSNPAHNLERHKHSGLLHFLDNESGLFHSYRLLDKYKAYHRSLLRGLCVYRRTTAERVASLHRQGDVCGALQSRVRSEEPLHAHVPRVPHKNCHVLQSRIADVLKQIELCESLHAR